MSDTQDPFADWLWIIDPANFDGFARNTMNSVTGLVHYMDEPTTLEQYKAKKGNDNLIALTWEDFSSKYMEPYNKGLCKPFRRTTKAAFWEALECLPPKRWTRGKTQEFFFIGECYTADLYSCYVRKGKLYYSALRSIHTPEADIFNLSKVN